MKHNSKRAKAGSSAPQGSTPWPLILGAGALLMILVGGLFLLRPATQPVAAPTGSVGGVGPQLTVDQEKLDFGDVKMNVPVKAAFRLTNTGDKPLQILGNPVVAVVEGC